MITTAITMLMATVFAVMKRIIKYLTALTIRLVYDIHCTVLYQHV